MNQILPYPLWLGHAGDGRDYRRIFAEGIQAIIYLAFEELSATPPRELICCRFPLLDGLGNDEQLLFLAANTAATFIQKQVPTLITCGAGMSRSVVMAAAGLTIAYGEMPEEWLRRVVEHHRGDVSPGLWSEVKAMLHNATERLDRTGGE